MLARILQFFKNIFFLKNLRFLLIYLGVLVLSWVVGKVVINKLPARLFTLAQKKTFKSNLSQINLVQNYFKKSKQLKEFFTMYSLYSCDYFQSLKFKQIVPKSFQKKEKKTTSKKPSKKNKTHFRISPSVEFYLKVCFILYSKKNPHLSGVKLIYRDRRQIKELFLRRGETFVFYEQNFKITASSINETRVKIRIKKGRKEKVEVLKLGQEKKVVL